MKIFLLVIFWLASVVMIGQKDILPIAQHGIWIEASGSWIIGEFVYNTPTGLAISDTVNVNDTLYLQFSSFGYCTGGQIFNDAFLLREDAGKYFYRQSASDEERLWFDFNLAVGDTILLDHCFPESEEEQVQLTVISVEPVTLGDGSERLKWTLQYSDNQSGYYLMTEEWIEGIGNVQQGWRHSTAQACIDIGHWLRCYYQDGNWVESFEFIAPGTDCCTLVGVDEQSIFDVAIYPNPATSEINILSIHIISTITVSDIMGCVALRIQPNSKQTQVNLESLPNGSYYITTTTVDGSTGVRQFIKE